MSPHVINKEFRIKKFGHNSFLVDFPCEGTQKIVADHAVESEISIISKKFYINAKCWDCRTTWFYI